MEPKERTESKLRVFIFILGFLVFLGLAGVVGGFYALHHYGRGLPDYKQLADYEPPMVTRIHAGDGRLMTEYATEKRIYVPVQAIPRRVVNSFLSAEDKNFFNHPGVDFVSLLRAVVTNLANIGQGRRLVGASTITQQVAKNFLLTNEVSYERKIKEALLAFRIERTFSKERILDLYLNEIYLGGGSYGVAAAALNYFNKPLDQLTIAEAAYLAALPKAPNNYHPIRKHEAAIARRNWVVRRLEEDGHISAEEAETARNSPLEVQRRDETEVVDADFFSEEVRRELVELYGSDQLYQGGMSVRTTLDPRLQAIADRVLRKGLLAYDRRHGWRGPVTQIELEGDDWQEKLAAVELPAGSKPWRLAVVLELSGKSAGIALADGTQGTLPMSELSWARKWLKNQRFGNKPKRPSEVLAVGDVVLVEAVEANAKGEAYEAGTFGLRQLPQIDGGLVALDPHTGRVLAMSGGFSFEQSQFNRATQAKRQPGSAFKPFVYLAGLDSGYTPATLILDAPFVIDQGPGLGKWKPANYSHKFYGPTPMRVGIEKSRNLMTVRLAQTIGMEKVADYAKRFGVDDNLQKVLSMSLGAGETTLMRMTTAYAMLVNGGKRITPSLIDRIQDRNGATIYRHDLRLCETCTQDYQSEGQVPELEDEREQIADPRSAYQVVSMLQGAVQRGTGQKIKAVGKPLAGKTGTTNDSFDSWFMGFSPDLAVGVFTGFDNPRTLGRRETGASIAAPIFRDFMMGALENQPAIPFRIPPGIRLVRLNAETGQLARPGDQKVRLEAFKPDNVPTGQQVLIDGGYTPSSGQGAVRVRGSSGGGLSGGLY
ncbi:penicillin-binding protein 1A [Pelagibius sp. Alg239-R121]|uniref:penicillin-binding protein 1A n=1 Tax=Pelagibius sp. Alg239-R121 TaxID=2993448 RepID=UPI002AC35896|nr:penicillin-binding protein 1A [Pelagibius sp. Alg239-R121]